MYGYNMINIIDESQCCGCGACSIVCPKECIQMVPKTLGHFFPKVKEDICIACGKCDQVCPMKQKKKKQNFKQIAYAAYAKEPEIRFAGSSGGMVGAFSLQLLRDNYIVYGAAFDSNLQLKCRKAAKESDLAILLKSKYLQSDLTCQYKKIKDNLENGKKVLFVSTPCQVAALKGYLEKEYENLLTIDFFCHGVPSQQFFDQCIKIDSRRLGGTIKKYQFRAKKRWGGVTPHYFSAEVEVNKKRKKITKIYYKSSFYAVFQKYINFRESCYNCQFANADRLSDITVGDFHEIDRYIDGINRFDGISTVIINSEKGEELWKHCSKQIIQYPVDLKMLISDGICFNGGTKEPKNREEFVRDYNNKPFKELIDKYVGQQKYWKHAIYYSMPEFFRKQLKKYIGI